MIKEKEKKYYTYEKKKHLRKNYTVKARRKIYIIKNKAKTILKTIEL